MKFAIFPQQVSIAGNSIYSNFAGLVSELDEVVPNSFDADAAIIWSVLWSGRMEANKKVYYEYRKQRKPVIILETGNLIRNRTYKLCVNNINAQGTHALDLDLDRGAILKTFSPITTKSDRILVCCQNEKSLLWEGMASSQVWVRNAIQGLHKDQVTIRLHPRFRSIVDLPGYNIIRPQFTDDDDTDFRDIAQHYGTIINHNSGSGIEAKMMGLTVKADNSSLANYMPEAIAKTEWFESELPKVWQHLRPKLEKSL
jgi:hypothetical protein